MERSPNFKSMIWLILFALTFALGNLMFRAAGLREIPSVPLLAHSLLVGSIVMIPMAGWACYNHSVPLSFLNLRRLLFVAMTATVIPFWLQLEGLRQTTATKGGIILSAIPVLTTIFSRLVLKRQPTIPLIVRLVLMTLGGVLISMEGSLAGFNAGDLMILAAASSFAISMVVAHQLLKEWPVECVVLGRFVIGTVCLYPIAFTESGDPFAHPDIPLFSITMGVLMVLFAVSIYKGMKGLGPEYAALFDIIAAGLTAVGSYVLWQELLSGVQWIGGAIILFLGIQMILSPPDDPIESPD